MRSKMKLALLVLIPLALGAARSGAEIIALEVEGIDNYSRFEGEKSFAGKRVGFGGSTDPGAMPWLKQQGYASVVNLRAAAEEDADVDESRVAAANSGLKYIHLPFDPNDPAPGVTQAFLAATIDTRNQPAYIHCGSGTRAAMFWMLGRVRIDRLGLEAAEREGRIIAEKPDEAVTYFSKRMLSQ